MAETSSPTSPAADFVRGLSAELTLREMDAAQKAAGFKLSHHRVYQIRHGEKLGFKRAEYKGRPRQKKKKAFKSAKRVTAREAIEAMTPSPRVPPSVDVKEQVRRLAMRIGLIRLAELVHEIEREVGM